MFNSYFSDIKILYMAFNNHLSYYYNKIVLFISTFIFNKFKVDIGHYLSKFQINDPSILMLAIIPFHFQINYYTLSLMVVVYVMFITLPHPILGIISGTYFGISSILLWHLHAEDIIDIQGPLFHIDPIIGVVIHYDLIYRILNGIVQSLVFTSVTAFYDVLVFLRLGDGEYRLIHLVIDTISWMMEHYQPFLDYIFSPNVEIVIERVITQVPRVFSLLFYTEHIELFFMSSVSIQVGDNIYRVFIQFVEAVQALEFLVWDNETQAWVLNDYAYPHFREVLAPCNGEILDIRPELEQGHWEVEQPVEVEVEVEEEVEEPWYIRSVDAYTIVPIIVNGVIIFLILSSTGVMIPQLV